MSRIVSDIPQSGSPRGHTLRRSLSLITIAWIFGSVWLTTVSGTPYTNFAKSLGASEFQFGVLAALPYIASLFSLPASVLTEITGRRKLLFLLGLYGQRVLWMVIGIVPVWMVRHAGRVTPGAVQVFIVLVLLMHCVGAMGGPGWLSWMGDIVPGRVRGKYFGVRRVWGAISQVPAAVAAGWALDRYAGPEASTERVLWTCCAIFGVSAVFGIADIATFHWVPEVPMAPRRGPGLLHAMKAPLKDRNFLWFGGYVATLTFAISFMGQFVTLYILHMLSLMPAGMSGAMSTNMLTQVMVLVAPGVAQLIVFPVWGKAADRMGKRPLLILAGLGLVPVAVGWCFVTGDRVWLGYVLSGLGAGFWAGVEVANLNMVLEMSAEADKKSGGGSGYIAVNAVIINVAGCMGGLASGAIAQALQDVHFQWVTSVKTFDFYDVLFGLSAMMRLLAIVVFVPFIKETHARPTHEALRYMTANIYNNLMGVARQPVRMVRSAVFGGDV